MTKPSIKYNKVVQKLYLNMITVLPETNSDKMFCIMYLCRSYVDEIRKILYD